MKHLLTCIFIFVILSSCKKENVAANAGTGKDTAFTSFIKFSDFVPTGQSLGGMDYHAGSKNLYCYMYKPGSLGYSIVQLNTQTKQALVVFTFNDGKWNSNNGSEGKRIRIFGNDLYVMGGANNTDFHKLTGIGTNTLVLSKVIKMPSNTGPTSPYWGESYDVAVADKLYVMTMRSKITYGNLNDLSSPGSFSLASSSHGASIVYASQGGSAYLASRNDSYSNIEVRNPVNGNYLRGITVTSGSSTGLVKDSKERIYFLDANNKILRLSPDLLTKEEFPAIGAYTYYQFAIAEEKGNIRLYEISGSEIKTMRIPL